MKKIIIVIANALFAYMVACSGHGPESESHSIISPIRSEGKLVVGDTIDVAWTGNIINPRIFYTLNKQGDNTWTEIADSTIFNSSGSHARIILPGTLGVSDSFQIRIQSGNDEAGAMTSEYLLLKEIIFTSSHDEKTYHVGDTIEITWRACAGFGSVRIKLSTNNGRTYNDISDNFFNPYQGIAGCNWIVGLELATQFSYPSTQCILWIQQYDRADLFDKSNVFSVLQ